MNDDFETLADAALHELNSVLGSDDMANLERLRILMQFDLKAGNIPRRIKQKGSIGNVWFKLNKAMMGLHGEASPVSAYVYSRLFARRMLINVGRQDLDVDEVEDALTRALQMAFELQEKCRLDVLAMVLMHSGIPGSRMPEVLRQCIGEFQALILDRAAQIELSKERKESNPGDLW